MNLSLISYRPAQPWLLVVLVGAVSANAQPAPGLRSPLRQTPAVLQRLSAVTDARGPALEVIATAPLQPILQTLENPPRLVIDLPNARVASLPKRLSLRAGLIKRVRLSQLQVTPPVARVVVDLREPSGYSTKTQGASLLVRLHPIAEARIVQQPPSVPALTAGVQPVAVPLNPVSAGILVEAGTRLGKDSTVTAGADTTILRLARGGEVRVCPGTTLSITTSESGRDLMLGMSTGTIEANYTLSSSADSVMTPDFRMLLAGPGDLHYAFSADVRGNTCIRALPGNTASVIVSELLGEGAYRVKPNEHILFRSGRVGLVEASIPDSCGCPPPPIPAQRAANPTATTVSDKELPAEVSLAGRGDEGRAVPTLGSTGAASSGFASSSQVTAAPATSDAAPVAASRPRAVRVQVDAPFVFRAADPLSPPSLEALPLARPTPSVFAWRELALPPRRTVLSRIRGFFAAIFR